ncbi:MAG: hypothetical protein WAV73_05190 [Candidatus Moraniibacteriota bacterium]
MAELYKSEKVKISPQESLEKKVFNPKDIEGNFNKETLSIVRDIHESLEKEKGYVGLIIFGSSVQGYYSNENSDLDIYFMHDSSSYERNNFFGKKQKEDYYHRVRGLLREVEDSALNKHGKEIHIPNWYWCDINPKKVIPKLQTGEGSTHGAIARLAELLGLSVGHKIDDYRKFYGRYLQTLPKEKREVFKEKIIQLKLDQDKISAEKRALRNEQFSQESLEDYLRSRKELWIRRMGIIYGI